LNNNNLLKRQKYVVLLVENECDIIKSAKKQGCAAVVLVINKQK